MVARISQILVFHSTKYEHKKCKNDIDNGITFTFDHLRILWKTSSLTNNKFVISILIVIIKYF